MFRLSLMRKSKSLTGIKAKFLFLSTIFLITAIGAAIATTMQSYNSLCERLLSVEKSLGGETYVENCLFFFIREMENGNRHNREQKRKGKCVGPKPSLNPVKSVEHLM